jgi:hypothetical protein
VVTSTAPGQHSSSLHPATHGLASVKLQLRTIFDRLASYPCSPTPVALTPADAGQLALWSVNLVLERTTTTPRIVADKANLPLAAKCGKEQPQDGESR